MLWILISLFFVWCAFREIRGSFVARLSTISSSGPIRAKAFASSTHHVACPTRIGWGTRKQSGLTTSDMHPQAASTAAAWRMARGPGSGAGTPERRMVRGLESVAGAAGRPIGSPG